MEQKKLHSLYQAITQSETVRLKYPDAEQMPMGYIFPGYDIEMIKPCTVLTYLLDCPTAWSCQGIHKDSPRWTIAYIVFQEGHEPPEDLLQQINEIGADCGWENPSKETGKSRFILRAFDPKTEMSEEEKLKKNKAFLKVLNTFSDIVINQNLSKFKDPHYKRIHNLFNHQR